MVSNHTTGKIRGEHFLTLETGLSVAQVMDKLRDHKSVVAVFAHEGSWRILSGEVLPELLLKGAEALQQPALELAQPLQTLPATSSLDDLREQLKQHSWVGVTDGAKLLQMLNWTSWARFASQHRLTSAYQFSPEWGRNDSSVAKV